MGRGNGPAGSGAKSGAPLRGDSQAVASYPEDAAPAEVNVRVNPSDTVSIPAQPAETADEIARRENAAADTEVPLVLVDEEDLPSAIETDESSSALLDDDELLALAQDPTIDLYEDPDQDLY